MHLIESVSLSSRMLSYLCQCSQQRRVAMLTALRKAVQSLVSQHALSQDENGATVEMK